MKKELFVFKITLLDDEIFNVIKEFDISSNDLYDLVKKYELINIIRYQILPQFFSKDISGCKYEIVRDPENECLVFQLTTNRIDEFEEICSSLTGIFYSSEIAYSFLKNDKPQIGNISFTISGNRIEIPENISVPRVIPKESDQERLKRKKKEEKILEYRNRKKKRSEWEEIVLNSERHPDEVKRILKHLVCEIKGLETLDNHSLSECHSVIRDLLKKKGLSMINKHFQSYKYNPKLYFKPEVNLKDILGRYLLKLQMPQQDKSWEVTIYEVSDQYKINFGDTKEIREYVLNEN